MKPSQLILNVTSENPQALHNFYQDVVGLAMDPISGGFLIGESAMFTIDGHSETKGKAQEPHRYLFSFRVNDIEAEQARLEAQGVQFIRRMGREFWGGVYSTFLDPDGNYAQLMQFDPAADRPADAPQHA